MFSFYCQFLYNYLFFFFDHGSLVMVCFFLFLFFALLSDQGQLSLYLQDLSSPHRLALSRHLLSRESSVLDLISSLDRSVSLKMKKLPPLFSSASRDLLLSLAFIVKSLSRSHNTSQIRYFLDNTLATTLSLSLQIRLYLSHDLFVSRLFKHHSFLPKLQLPSA